MQWRMKLGLIYFKNFVSSNIFMFFIFWLIFCMFYLYYYVYFKINYNRLGGRD